MKLEDEVRERLRSLGDGIRADAPPAAGVRLRGRALRLRRLIAGGLASVVVVGGLVASLTLLGPLRPGSEEGRVVAASGTSARVAMPFGVSVEPPEGWTLLGLAGEDIEPPPPAASFQLTNFHPDVFGTDPSEGWLCPPGRGSLPADGVALVVRVTDGPASAEWPVPLDAEPQVDGWCGIGWYARWKDRGFRLDGVRLSYEAFATVGAEASGEDRRRLFATFDDLRLTDRSDWFGPSNPPKSPSGPWEIVGSGSALGEPWRVAVASGEGSGCDAPELRTIQVEAGARTCFQVDGDGNLVPFDDQTSRTITWSTGWACPADRGDALGAVIADAARVEISASGETIVVQPTDIPTTADVPLRLVFFHLRDDPHFDFVVRDALGNVLDRGTYDPAYGQDC